MRILKLVLCVLLSMSQGIFSPGSAAQRLSDANAASLRTSKPGYVRNNKSKRVIVFVNGIFGDAITTWTNRKTNRYWPAMLLNDHDFDNLDIYVFSFDSPKIKTAQSIEELAERMRVYLDSDMVLQSHEQAVFICHSMGGLVTRQYLLRVRPSPGKVPMIYFFATPTTGANVTEIAKHLSANPQLQDMLPLGDGGYVGSLQDDWLSTSNDPTLDYPDKIASFCAYEKLDTWGVVRVVERQSATNLCNRPCDGIMTDHIDIVKPEDEGTETYRSFKAAYLRSFSILPADVVLAAVKLQEGNQPPNWSQGVEFTVDGTTYAVRRFASKKGIGVTSGQRSKGITRIDFPQMAPGEGVIQINPVIDDSINLKSSSVALVNFDQKGATIRYSLQAQDVKAGDPPYFWHANVIVYVVVSRR